MERLRLALVCPCYNEEEMLPLSAPRLKALLEDMIAEGKIAPDSFVLFVNDGSRDATWDILRELCEESSLFHALNLAHNVGHQNAIMAGMLKAVEKAGAVVTLDVDLQDDIRIIPKMVDAYYEGTDVVYAVRSSRATDSFLKRFTAEAFYKMQQRLGVKSIYNHADYRFMSARVVRELERYHERNLYLRGIIPMIGYPSRTMEVERLKREAGETKYTLRKMLTLAMDGVTSFSITPIYWILGMGGIFLLIAVAIGIYVLVSLITHSAAPGWASLMLSIWFVGGVILLAVGVVGVYVGRVYIEAKHRPRYHIQDEI